VGIDVFSRTWFEEKLVDCGWYNRDATGDEVLHGVRHLGLIDGEYCYLLEVFDHGCRGGDFDGVGVMIRSSVGESGYSGGTGENSIRCWLVDANTLEPLGSKVCRWTTRLPGWEDRAAKIVVRLLDLACLTHDCPGCDTLLHIYKVKKQGPNRGRWFLKCPECGHFEWLDGVTDRA
jgi:hypothetical protein